MLHQRLQGSANLCYNSHQAHICPHYNLTYRLQVYTSMNKCLHKNWGAFMYIQGYSRIRNTMLQFVSSSYMPIIN